MKLQSENEPYDEINITPMLDLAYVLLIIFIIMTTATVQGIVAGQLYLDTYPVTMSELESRLRSFKAITPDLPVVIKGDAKIQYEKVIEVMDLMGKLDITHLGLVTQKLVK